MNFLINGQTTATGISQMTATGEKPDPDIQRLLSTAAVLTSSIGLR